MELTLCFPNGCERQVRLLGATTAKELCAEHKKQQLYTLSEFQIPRLYENGKIIFGDTVISSNSPRRFEVQFQDLAKQTVTLKIQNFNQQITQVTVKLKQEVSELENQLMQAKMLLKNTGKLFFQDIELDQKRQLDEYNFKDGDLITIKPILKMNPILAQPLGVAQNFPPIKLLKPIHGQPIHIQPQPIQKLLTILIDSEYYQLKVDSGQSLSALENFLNQHFQFSEPRALFLNDQLLKPEQLRMQINGCLNFKKINTQEFRLNIYFGKLGGIQLHTAKVSLSTMISELEAQLSQHFHVQDHSLFLENYRLPKELTIGQLKIRIDQQLKFQVDPTVKRIFKIQVSIDNQTIQKEIREDQTLENFDIILKQSMFGIDFSSFTILYFCENKMLSKTTSMAQLNLSQFQLQKISCRRQNNFLSIVIVFPDEQQQIYDKVSSFITVRDFLINIVGEDNKNSFELKYKEVILDESQILAQLGIQDQEKMILQQAMQGIKIQFKNFTSEGQNHSAIIDPKKSVLDVIRQIQQTLQVEQDIECYFDSSLMEITRSIESYNIQNLPDANIIQFFIRPKVTVIFSFENRLQLQGVQTYLLTPFGALLDQLVQDLFNHSSIGYSGFFQNKRIDPMKLMAEQGIIKGSLIQVKREISLYLFIQGFFIPHKLIFYESTTLQDIFNQCCDQMNLNRNLYKLKLAKQEHVENLQLSLYNKGLYDGAKIYLVKDLYNQGNQKIDVPLKQLQAESSLISDKKGESQLREEDQRQGPLKTIYTRVRFKAKGPQELWKYHTLAVQSSCTLKEIISVIAPEMQNKNPQIFLNQQMINSSWETVISSLTYQANVDLLLE